MTTMLVSMMAKIKKRNVVHIKFHEKLPIPLKSILERGALSIK
jgi:hypothetical protein